MNPPLFTFRHYAAVIRVLRETNPYCGLYVRDNHVQLENTIIRDGQWNKTANALADMFAQDNPRFKRDLFIAECNKTK